MHQVSRYLQSRTPRQLVVIAVLGVLLIVGALQGGWATTAGDIAGTICVVVGVAYILASVATGLVIMRDRRRL